jgi:hypothetical protein
VFPTDAGGEEVVLFEGGEVINLSKPTNVKSEVTLQSNFSDAEGWVKLFVGNDKPVLLGKLHIEWKIFGEWDDHPATVTAQLNPADRTCHVVVQAENVKFHGGVHGKAEVYLSVRGGYDRV